MGPIVLDAFSGEILRLRQKVPSQGMQAEVKWDQRLSSHTHLLRPSEAGRLLLFGLPPLHLTSAQSPVNYTLTSGLHTLTCAY